MLFLVLALNDDGNITFFFDFRDRMGECSLMELAVSFILINIVISTHDIKKGGLLFLIYNRKKKSRYFVFRIFSNRIILEMRFDPDFLKFTV
jgi:hypothetical protein